MTPGRAYRHDYGKTKLRALLRQNDICKTNKKTKQKHIYMYVHVSGGNINFLKAQQGFCFEKIRDMEMDGFFNDMHVIM